LDAVSGGETLNVGEQRTRDRISLDEHRYSVEVEFQCGSERGERAGARGPHDLVVTYSADVDGH
jgi:hypothetical protein